MIKNIFAGILACSALGNAIATEPNNMKEWSLVNDAMETYSDCMFETAGRHEETKSLAPKAVADAATKDCSPQLDAYRGKFSDYLRAVEKNPDNPKAKNLKDFDLATHVQEVKIDMNRSMVKIVSDQRKKKK